jgi:DNA polymerase III gamma/tau subunit
VLELYRKHRPTRTDGIAGQAEALKILRKLDPVPHAMLFEGPSGCGKTTLARIMAKRVGCDPNPRNPDFCEVNCGVVDSAIDMVREIQMNMSGAAMNGGARVWILDEVQSLSRAKFAQEAMLKILEDGQDHVWFFLATTDPKKILLTIRNRCTQIKLTSIPDKDLSELVKRVAAAEGAKLSTDLIEKIVEASDGSARAALVNLEKVIKIEGDADQIKAIGRVGGEAAAFDLVKAILPWKGPPDWKAAVKVLESIKEEDPEGIRLMILASARSQLLKMSNPAAVNAIYALEKPLYDRTSGHALLAAACYEICHPKR